MARKTNGLVALDAGQATISTCTVTIKALKVNNRQLTQAVFRQLPERELVDEEKIDLLGIPWGWVNYRTQDMGAGRQFVAQFGRVLCRCPVMMSCSCEFPRYKVDYSEVQNSYSYSPSGFRKLRTRFHRIADWWFRSVILADGLDDCHFVAHYGHRSGFSDVPIVTKSFPCFGATSRRVLDLPSEWTKAINGIYMPVFGRAGKIFDHEKQKYVEKSREEVVADGVAVLRQMFAAHEVDPELAPDYWVERMDHLDAIAADYCRRWDDLIGRLEAVEQLFIAT